MTRTYQLSDFPLKRIDSRGRPLAVGDFARVIATPDIDFHGFDVVARERYAVLKGNVFPIHEFDENGYAVLFFWYKAETDIIGNTGEPPGMESFDAQDFCFDSRDLELL